MNAQIQPTLTHAVPLNLLIASPANVRKTNPKAGIEELAANILAYGLRQNLNVRKTADGKSEVIAGGRRLLALQLLHKQGKIPAEFLVTCLDVGDNAEEISLAENTMRENMHPSDEFEAYNALIVAGASIEDVGAKFGKTTTYIKQRMKFAGLSEKVRKDYRAGKLTLEQLMAFTVSSDKKLQEKVLKEMNDWTDADDIKEALTENTIDAKHDSLGKFVTLEAYVAAGGEVERDLFDGEDAGYMKDTDLVNSLAMAKLEAEAEKLKKEGWKWVEHAPSFSHDNKLGRIYGAKFTKEEKARAGVRVGISYNGGIDITRGLVRPEDATKEKKAGDKKETAPKEVGVYAQSQIETLTAHRTAAMRLGLMGNPKVAKVAVVHALALSAFFERNYEVSSAMEIYTKPRNLEPLMRGTIADCLTAKDYDGAVKAMKEKLPKKPEQLWGALLAMQSNELDEVLAVAAAFTLDAVQPKFPETRKMNNVKEIAAALNLDMGDHFEPTETGFIATMKKAQRMKALQEVNLPDVAANVGTMKAAAGAKATATALKGKRWLPSVLRPDNKKAKAGEAA